jgi:hypothetical protein
MMPKFALNQMPNRGEESISPLSFHSNSSSSSNLSYQKRYQDGPGANGSGGNGQGNEYTNSRYYYNKYKSHDEMGQGGGGNNGSSRIIYKTTGANSSNGNSIRFLKKAYSSKYEEHEGSSSIGLISNKNILDNASRVITAADHRNLKKKLLQDDDIDPADDVKANEEKKSPADEANNNSKNSDKSGKHMTEVNANDLMSRNDLNNKKRPDDISNHLDDIFNDLSLNQLLDDKITEERESSRFSKWFNRGNDDGVAVMKNESNNNNAALFRETEKYFQPIDKMEHNSSLFDMLKGNNSDQLMNMMQSPISQPKPQKSPGGSGQIHSVEELEAKLRHHKSEEEQKGEKVLQNFFQQQLMPNLMQQQAPAQMPHSQNQNQEEINAFKKLLSQMAAEDQNKMIMTNNGQPQQQVPNMLQQLMNKNFQQDVMLQQQQQQFQKTFPGMGSQGIKSPGGNAPGKMLNHMIPQQPPFGGNLDMKFLQQQQQQKIPAPMPEIVKRPEVQALVQGNILLIYLFNNYIKILFRINIRRDFAIQLMATIDNARPITDRP